MDLLSIVRLHTECVNAAVRVTGTLTGSNANTRARYAHDLAEKKFREGLEKFDAQKRREPATAQD